MSNDPNRLLQLLQQLNTPIRIRVISLPIHGMSEGRPEPDRQVTGNLRVSGLKFILDGTPVERSMAIRKPYQDDPSGNGQLDFSEEFIRRAVRSAAETNHPVYFMSLATGPPKSYCRPWSRLARTLTGREGGCVLSMGMA
jgi:predicted amidohydrolase YtcJ